MSVQHLNGCMVAVNQTGGYPPSPPENDRSSEETETTHEDELPASIDDWPEVWRFSYEERAAIYEYDYNNPRDEAEREAERAIREEFARRDEYEYDE